MFEASAPPPLVAGIPHIYVSTIIERHKADAAYRAGPMSQDRQILADPGFQNYHRRIVAGSKIAGTVGVIRQEARMIHSRTPAERVRRVLDEHPKARATLRDLEGLMKMLQHELKEARNWIAGKIPPLHHFPPAVAEVVCLWRGRGPAEVEVEQALRTAGIDTLRAEIGGKRPAHVVALALADAGPDVIAAEIAAARPYWNQRRDEAEEGLRDAQEVRPALQVKAEQEVAAERRAQQATIQRPGGTPGPGMG